MYALSILKGIYVLWVFLPKWHFSVFEIIMGSLVPPFPNRYTSPPTPEKAKIGMVGTKKHHKGFSHNAMRGVALWSKPISVYHNYITKRIRRQGVFIKKSLYIFDFIVLSLFFNVI